MAENNEVNQGQEIQTRLVELENQLGIKDKRIAELETAVNQSGENLAKHQESLKQAVVSYRTMVVRANPDVLEELINGDSIEAVEGSLKAARELISKIKRTLNAGIVKVPGGAPPRMGPDSGAMSSRGENPARAG